jgi:hypothetical protein
MDDDLHLWRLVATLEADLTKRHGHILKGSALWQSLGYGSRSTFQRALVARSVGVKTFPIPGRRGQYALTRDVARYLATLRLAAENDD